MTRKSSIVAAAALLAATAAVPAWAYQINAPGSYQDQLVPAQTNWTPETAPLWTETGAGSNIWQLSLTGLALPSGSYAYKILNTPDAQTPSWAGSVQVTPADSWFTPKLDGSANLYLDYTNQSAPKWGFDGVWQPRLVGNFTNESGGANDWDPADPLFDMSSSGTNTWAKSITVSTPGNYEVKLTDGIPGAWTNRQFGLNGYRDDAATFAFTTTLANQQVDFNFNQLTAAFSVIGVTPTPPTWKNNTSGEWLDPVNWLGNTGAPNGIDAEAIFGNVIDYPRIIYNNGNTDVTVGKMTFDNANTYQIVGNWGLIMESATTAEINVVQGTHKINLPLTFASDTDLDVAPTATLKISDPVTIAPGVTVSETNTGTVTYESTVTVQSGAIIAMNSPQRLAAISIANGATAKTNGTTGSRIDGLNLTSGGKLDVNNGGVVLPNESVTDVRNALIAGSGGAGFGAQTWDQPGIMSTSASADPLSYAVGYMDNDNFILGAKSTFDGVTVPGGSVLVKSTLAGDADLDWDVDDDDVTVLGIFYGGPGHWYEADFDYTGFVDDDDVTIMGITYGQSLPGASAAGVAAVPEPTSFAAIALAAGAGLMRRRRNV